MGLFFNIQKKILEKEIDHAEKKRVHEEEKLKARVELERLHEKKIISEEKRREAHESTINDLRKQKQQAKEISLNADEKAVLERAKLRKEAATRKHDEAVKRNRAHFKKNLAYVIKEAKAGYKAIKGKPARHKKRKYTNSSHSLYTGAPSRTRTRQRKRY